MLVIQDVNSMSVCSGAITITTTTLEWQEKSKHITNTAVNNNRPGIYFIVCECMRAQICK